MWFTLLVGLAVLPMFPAAQTVSSASVKADVDRLVRAAERLTDEWPFQPPPPVREVALVARHGRAVVPTLTALLSDDPNVERDRKRWKVQQQATLALSRIYSEGPHCGRVYCDGDLAERNGRIKSGWLAAIAADAEIRALSTGELVERFEREPVFYRQFEVGRALAGRGDRAVIAELAPRLGATDRHLRGNVAFVLARLGDPRGFDTIAQILSDRSPRSEGQGIPGVAGNGDLRQEQVRADRYYAAHLLGDLKDRRGVPLLVPLLSDKDVRDIVPWSLGRIGDHRAVEPLLQLLAQDDLSMRLLAISALEQLDAREALPRLQELSGDERKPHPSSPFTLGQAARHAVAAISQAQ